MANVPATEGITDGSGQEGRVKAFFKQALPNHAVLISLPPLHTAFYELPCALIAISSYILKLMCPFVHYSHSPHG